MRLDPSLQAARPYWLTAERLRTAEAWWANYRLGAEADVRRRADAVLRKGLDTDPFGGAKTGARQRRFMELRRRATWDLSRRFEADTRRGAKAAFDAGPRALGSWLRGDMRNTLARGILQGAVLGRGRFELDGPTLARLDDLWREAADRVARVAMLAYREPTAAELAAELARNGGDADAALAHVRTVLRNRAVAHAGAVMQGYVRAAAEIGAMTRMGSGPVRWVLGRGERHCGTCPAYAAHGPWPSLEALLAATGGPPGAAATACVVRCKCHLEPETRYRAREAAPQPRTAVAA